MAIIENPNDTQNMFSKAGKITSEKYIIFQRKDEIINNKPRYFKGKSVTNSQEKGLDDMNQQTDKKITDLLASGKQKDKQDPKAIEIDKVQKGNALKLQQPFTKQLSRAMAHYTKISNDEPPPCGYYHPKYSELDKAIHSVPHYEKTLITTTPKEVPNKHGKPDNSDKPIVDRPRYKRDCFVDLKRQIDRPDIFKGRTVPHDERFKYLTLTDTWSKIPRTPSTELKNCLSRDEMIIYKKKSYAPDYKPNYEFGRRQLGSCGASFDKLEKRKDIMVKVPPYTNEAYYDYDMYYKEYDASTKDKSSKKERFEFDKDKPTKFNRLFRTPTAPNFKKMLDRECDHKSLLPCYIQKFTNNRMALTFVHQKMLEVNNFRDGRFQTVTSSFGNFAKKKKKLDESSDDEIEQDDH